MIKIYHNPRCTKSRQTVELLTERGEEFETILYLENAPTEDEIKDVVAKLGVSVREIIRKNEAEYKENKLSDKVLTDEQLIAAIAKFPKLLERPIVVNGKHARVGRPPSNVLEIL